ncbi:unnamed protein product [Rotaria sp. Silwood1]|nr:unnamed protein product [Rotaria sp. Silwood1]
MSILVIFLLIFYVNIVSNLNDTTQLENFTIEWQNFDLLKCAVPTTINVSLFNCLPSPNYTQVDDISCLEESIMNFQESMCQSTSTTMSFINWEGTTTQSSSLASSTIQMTNSITTDSLLIKSSSVSQMSSMITNDINHIKSNITSQTSSPTVVSSTIRATTIDRIQTSVTTAHSGTYHTSIATTINLSTTIPRTTMSPSTVKPTITIESTSTITETSKQITKENSYDCPEDTIGSSCNISSDACSMLQPCLNAATCFPNNTLSLKYHCQCQSGYTGRDCENDQRICRENTCLNDGVCIELNILKITSNNNQTNFLCECKKGYLGIHCELKVDFCDNITCQNNGICRTIDMIPKCICLDLTLFYGKYCEFQTTSLKTRKIVNKSFASVAITAIIVTCSFVILMDVLKYIFHIDPVKSERKKYVKSKQKNRRKQILKSNVTKPAIRFLYVA